MSPAPLPKATTFSIASVGRSECREKLLTVLSVSDNGVVMKVADSAEIYGGGRRYQSFRRRAILLNISFSIEHLTSDGQVQWTVVQSPTSPKTPEQCNPCRTGRFAVRPQLVDFDGHSSMVHEDL